MKQHVLDSIKQTLFLHLPVGGRALLFGSQARDEATENSDYDFYIKRGNLRGMFQLSGLFLDMQRVLNQKVDIVIDPEGHKKLDDYIANAIQKDGILVYAKSA